VEALLQRLLDARAGILSARPNPHIEIEAVEARLAALARMRGHAGLKTALEERGYDRRAMNAKPRASKPVATPEKLWDSPRPKEGRRMLVTNAGLVLAAAFLPPLFARLDLLGPDGRFLSGEAAGRGAHFLQYLVDERLDAPEPLLVLNKMLCGLAPEEPVPASVEVEESERATCDSLLASMIQNWPMMRGSSVAALRETFFVREGALTRIDGGWRLDVERRVLDVLLDELPWSFSMVLHPWMAEPLNVSW
jgi:hypothetical protein